MLPSSSQLPSLSKDRSGGLPGTPTWRESSSGKPLSAASLSAPSPSPAPRKQQHHPPHASGLTQQQRELAEAAAAAEARTLRRGRSGGAGGSSEQRLLAALASAAAEHSDRGRMSASDELAAAAAAMEMAMEGAIWPRRQMLLKKHSTHGLSESGSPSGHDSGSGSGGVQRAHRQQQLLQRKHSVSFGEVLEQGKSSGGGGGSRATGSRAAAAAAAVAAVQEERGYGRLSSGGAHAALLQHRASVDVSSSPMPSRLQLPDRRCSTSGSNARDKGPSSSVQLHLGDLLYGQ